MHAGPDVLHRFWHERRHVGGAVKTKRAHSQTSFGKLGSLIEFAFSGIANDFVQCGKMVAHVVEHMLLHGLRQADEFARSLGLHWGS